MFRGRYEHAIDTKGRTSVPARFREALSALGEAKLVLTTGLDTCLLAYPMGEWLAFEQRLGQLPQFDESVRLIKRIYVSGAVECDCDRVGRLLIPAALRKHAGLGKAALFAGMGSHIEVWSPKRFEKLRKQVLDDESYRADIAQRLAELGL